MTALACASAAAPLDFPAADAGWRCSSLLLEPHPATAATSAIAAATAPAPRRDLLHADVSGDMCILLVTGLWVGATLVCVLVAARVGRVSRPCGGAVGPTVRLAPPVRLARRWMPVTASAAISTTPTNMSAAHGGALARPSPVVPVPSSRTAMIVPQALNRPCLSWVAPRKAAAKAGSR